ncbi:hypothetical protein GO988_08105 [Hymenobacter sp. HMF4947]|uniref:Uncharacterized protein n=1 Tax=Hymenobacter ginkgonis TaxID=2682976 RepID=A0A7K1TD18_9BACT|nr:hypothetical protein [Hymenobacter ginkgonis]MVN76285.1 hypothetical protein [Hymenobacter ginkgonis]
MLAPFYRSFRRLLLSAGLLLGTQAAFAQASAALPHGYDFLTITIVKSPYKADCRMLLTPAFQGKTEVKLEEEFTLAADKYRENLHRNTLLLNQTLSDLSVAGWELVETHAAPEGPPPVATVTRYLLRKAKS